MDNRSNRRPNHTIRSFTRLPQPTSSATGQPNSWAPPPSRPVNAPDQPNPWRPLVFRPATPSEQPSQRSVVNPVASNERYTQPNQMNPLLNPAPRYTNDPFSDTNNRVNPSLNPNPQYTDDPFTSSDDRVNPSLNPNPYYTNDPFNGSNNPTPDQRQFQHYGNRSLGLSPMFSRPFNAINPQPSHASPWNQPRLHQNMTGAALGTNPRPAYASSQNLPPVQQNTARLPFNILQNRLPRLDTNVGMDPQPSYPLSLNQPPMQQNWAGGDFDALLHQQSRLDNNAALGYTQDVNPFPRSYNFAMPSTPSLPTVMPQQLASLVPRGFTLRQQNDAQQFMRPIQPAMRQDFSSMQNMQAPTSTRHFPTLQPALHIRRDMASTTYTSIRQSAPTLFPVDPASSPPFFSLNNDSTFTNNRDNQAQQHQTSTNPGLTSNLDDSNPAQAETSSDTGGEDTESVKSKTQKEKFLEMRRQGISYKVIKEKLGMWQTESALRGMYRTMTKAREDRVRKPTWTVGATNDLRKIVDGHIARIRGQHRQGATLSLAKILNLIPWSEIAQQLRNLDHYHYGSATVKKKYKELVNLLPPKTQK